MKTAVLLSGHMRSFDRCLPTLHWHVFRHLGEVDFFVSTVSDADAPKAELLRAKYPQSRVEIEVVPEQPDCVADMRAKGVELPAYWQPPPSRGEQRKRDIDYYYTHEPYAITVHPQAVLRQLWQLERVWNLFTNTTDRAAYDCVVRCRPDLWFHGFTLPRWFASAAPRSTLLVDGRENIALTPWWGRFGGVNDRFALLGTDAAVGYFKTYLSVSAYVMVYGCPLHPESLVKASLEAYGASIIDDLQADFSTLRGNGEMRAPEVSAQDLAHVALTR